ncbi:MAG: gliding motility protein GldL [Sediminibacterium sp.]|nr:gliding motility protein GldL [Sediminibacterium sp.]
MAAAIPPKVSKWFDVGVSIAAAVVIYGALQKILHTEIADLMLKIGLGTEALIFVGYGVLYLIYPAIDDHEVHLPGKGQPVGNPALSSLDKMLQEADITPANLAKLSAGFQKLGSTVEKMGEIGDVVKSTGDFSAKSREASDAMGAVITAASNAAQSLKGFGEANDATKQFHNQMQTITKNLSSLNTIYELELQESNNHLKALNQFYGKLAQTTSILSGGEQDAAKAKEQISLLANNLTKLNQVYGNMLTAMNGR